MYHAACEAEFQQIIQSVELTAGVFRLLRDCRFVWCNWYLVLLILWCVPCIHCCSVLVLDVSVTNSNTHIYIHMMSLFICHMEVDSESVVIDRCTSVLLILATDTLEFHVCFYRSSCEELSMTNSFRSFQDTILTYSKWISPIQVSIGSTKCDHLQ